MYLRLTSVSCLAQIEVSPRQFLFKSTQLFSPESVSNSQSYIRICNSSIDRRIKIKLSSLVFLFYLLYFLSFFTVLCYYRNGNDAVKLWDIIILCVESCELRKIIHIHLSPCVLTPGHHD